MGNVKEIKEVFGLLRRAVHMKIVRKNARILDQIIDESPFKASDRDGFWHLKLDSVIGTKDRDEPCALTLVERMTRNSLRIRLTDHSAEAATNAMIRLTEHFGDRARQAFNILLQSSKRSPIS